MGRSTTRHARQSSSNTSRPRLESLEARENPTVHFYGGNLLPAVEAQPVYYGSAWSSDASTRSNTDAFLHDLTGGAYMDALNRAGYGVGRGSSSTGVIDSISIASGTVITDASIQARLKADISGGLLPRTDANRLYVVYVEPNVAVNLGAGEGTTQQGILGYHGAFTAADGSAVRYTVIAYPGGAAHNSSLGVAANDQLTAVTSHELAEAVTDPDVNYRTLGWYDPQRGEIGDITENNPNALIRLDGFLVQEVADKNDQLLVISASPPVSPPPVSPPPVSPPTTSTGTTTRITASPVSYHWWYATTSVSVTVQPASGSAVPGGTVELIYGGHVLGSARVRVVNGVATATFNLTFYANGNYNFSAHYVGSGQFQSSTSTPVTVTV